MKRRRAILANPQAGSAQPDPAPQDAVSGIIYKPWDEAKRLIWDADILLFDAVPGSFESGAIGLLSMSDKSHVELAKRWGSMVCSVGMVEDPGGRAIALEKHLKDGRTVSIYRVKATSRQRTIASDAILEGLKWNYNTRAIKRQIWLKAAFLRLWTRWHRSEEIQAARDDDSNGNWHDMMCVEFVSKVWRVAGIDLKPHMADWAMAPVEVSESPLCRYLFTLELPAGQE